MKYLSAIFSGSHLYVSEKGSFEIYVDNTLYGNFGPGVAFGELALLYNTKRLSSIDGIDIISDKIA